MISDFFGQNCEFLPHYLLTDRELAICQFLQASNKSWEDGFTNKKKKMFLRGNFLTKTWRFHLLQIFLKGFEI